MAKTGPSPYQGTTNNPKYGFISNRTYYYDSSGNTLYDVSKQTYYNYVSGNSYIAPALRYPDYTWARNTPTSPVTSLTFSYNIDVLVNDLKNFPPGKRGFQPFAYNSVYERIYYFDEDKVFVSGQPSANYYLRDWGTTSAANYSGSLWCTAGISTQYDYWRSWFTTLSSRGATVDVIYMDNEGIPFSGDWFNTNVYNGFVADPRFTNSFKGFSSMADVYTFLLGTGATYQFNGGIWYQVTNYYKSINFTKAYYDSLASVYPNAYLSDYTSVEGVGYTYEKGAFPLDPNNTVSPNMNYAELFGLGGTILKQTGNASSPVLYGWFRDIGNDWSRTFYIRGDDSTKVYAPSNQEPFSYKDSFILPGPWASFIQAMSALRNAKMGNPNRPLTPWIGSVYMTADGYVLKGAGFDSSAYYGQSPPNVLSTLWRKVGISSVTKGFTAPDGSTTGFRVVFNTPTTIGSVWYKQNSTINGESGITNSYSIQVFGNTGSTSALAYYVSGLNPGQTYIFGYDIDLNRGYTGNLARFTVWSTSDVAVLAPLRPNTSTAFGNVLGITFNQILPVTGGNVYRQSGISYNAGNSSWTRVAWSFVPQSSSTNIGLHVYFAEGLTYSVGGYTTWIRNPSLFNQTLGTTFAINQIDNYTTASRTTLSYYYNEITAGVTYVFSYYLNLNQNPGLTYPFARQSINDFYTSTYRNTLDGVTMQQFEPIVSGISSGLLPLGITTGSSGWTKFVYKFIKGKRHPDVAENPSVELGLYNRVNHYSVVEPAASSSALAGFCAFVWQPKLELEGITANIDLNVTPLDSEYNGDYMEWRSGPPGGFCDIKKGYDSLTNVFCSERGGNSAYYYELIRHTFLHGTQSFGFFNPMSFEDMGITGCKPRGRYNGNNSIAYLTSGRTGYLKEFETLNQCLQDIHDKVGGFTTGTATYGPVDWNGKYFLSGMPDTKGITWWWRITVKPGHTMYINGLTLSAANPGAWVTTNSSSFSGVTFTITDFPVTSEPGISAAIKDFNFLTMNTLAGLTASGCNFSRGSTASYIGPSGYVAYVGVNQPRFEYYPDTLQPRGLLLERAATNLLNWSESFANTGGADNNWIDSGLIRVSNIMSPQGITNGIRFVSTSLNGTLVATVPVLGGSTAFRSFSFWARGISGNEQLSYTIDGGTSWIPVINLSTSWKRFTFGPWFTGSSVEYPYTKLLNNTLYHSNHVGFRITGTGSSVELWGAQVENRTPVWGPELDPNMRRRSTSYIPTQGASASRSADSWSIPSSSVSTWLGTTQGTFILEQESMNWVTGRFNVSGTGLATYLDMSASNAIMYWSPGGLIPPNGQAFLTRYIYPTVLYPIDIPLKIIWTYNSVGTKMCGAGHLTSTSWSSTFPGWNANTSINPIGPISGIDSIHIRRLRHWNSVMNDQDMIDMSMAGVELFKWMNRGDGGRPVDAK